MKEVPRKTKLQIKLIAMFTYLVVTSPVWGIGVVFVYSAFKGGYYAVGTVLSVLGMIYGAAKLFEADILIDLEMNMALKKQ